MGSNPTPRTIVEHPAVNEILTKYLNYLLCKKRARRIRDRVIMEKDNPCKDLLNRTFVDTVADEILKKQLIQCLHKEVFTVGGLRLFFDEENAMFIEFTEDFFANQPDLLWREKPSDTRIKKFYEILMRLQRDFGNDFMVSGYRKPSSTNSARVMDWRRSMEQK